MRRSDLAGHEKEKYVERMFSAIAPKYDLLNTVLSFARHKNWRRFAITKSGLQPGGHALDVCCGTGDFLIDAAKAVGETGRSVGLDFSGPMLEIAAEKLNANGIDRVELVRGNACCLPFADDSFDCVTVGFGIRNIFNPASAIAEMARVTAPEGRIVCLEIAKVRTPLLRSLWEFYFYRLPPVIAKALGSKVSAYRYLPESVKEFVSREELKTIFENAGLEEVRYYDLTFGTVCVHVGKKP